MLEMILATFDCKVLELNECINKWAVYIRCKECAQYQGQFDDTTSNPAKFEDHTFTYCGDKVQRKFLAKIYSKVAKNTIRIV